jgi:F-type H+-transporting ATPase subunit b
MGDLGIHLGGLLTQLISFSVLAFLLYKLLYGPIVRMLDQRSERIKASLEAADRARAEAASSAAQVEQEIVNARQEGQALIAQAREAAGRLREQEEAHAREQVEEMLERTRAEIQRERNAAVEELRREFAGLAVLAAEKVVERELDGTRHRELIDSVLEEGFSQRRN